MVGLWLGVLVMAWHGGQTWLAIPQVDIAEINHVYDGDDLRFKQLLVWTWHHGENAAHCEAWRIIDGWTRTPWGVVAWSQKNTERWQLRAAIVRETHTDYDPERLDLAVFPVHLRIDPWSIAKSQTP